ncbi:hypothetical protein CSUI_000641 [Cystoisospora suis]|uniref:Uncharacterized protein n=1 Tax=Cystoisospora suis TaxID=483139 RepID=A0A2C6LFD9_9APIC|nr:hypothetical protein CSUI_000641 [Cystoisospora suis]
MMWLLQHFRPGFGEKFLLLLIWEAASEEKEYRWACLMYLHSWIHITGGPKGGGGKSSRRDYRSLYSVAAPPRISKLVSSLEGIFSVLYISVPILPSYHTCCMKGTNCVRRIFSIVQRSMEAGSC